MKIWELLPMNTDDPNWGASTFRDRVVIRAETAERARDIAHDTFAVTHLQVPGTDAIHTPWRDHEMVVCRELTGGRYPADGDEAVLDPAGYERADRRLESVAH